MKNDLHHKHEPKTLWLSRDEYQEFPLEVFRNHIYQEQDKEMKQAARFDKKKLRSMSIRDSVRQTVLTGEEQIHVRNGGDVPARQSTIDYPT